jgi:glutathione S-transferase
MKVAIAIDLLGLGEHVTRRESSVAMTRMPTDNILTNAPLGKIPVLIVEGFAPLPGSGAIVEYLDRLSGSGKLIPRSLADWMSSSRREALADGLIDILVLWRTEVTRGASADERITQGFAIKAKATLSALERDAAGFDTEQFDVGHISCVCLLAYLDFRYPDCGWRASAPRLAAWYASMCMQDAVTRNQFRDSDGATIVTVPFSFSEATR